MSDVDGPVTININEVPKKPDYVTNHDGAGALLMTEPNFMEFIRVSTQPGGSDKVIGRLINGTGLVYLGERTQAKIDNPPWLKVRVIDGEYKDKEGWLLQNTVAQPR